VISVILYGELGKLYGKVHNYSVKNVPEAIKALEANFKGFTNSIHKDSHYKVIVDKTAVGEDEIGKIASKTIKIVPLIQGAKNGLGQTILGAVLIVVGAFTAVWGGEYFISVGISLMLGGISQMLTKTPKLASGADRPDNKPSYAFDGPVNTTAQGNPVPLCYGKMLVGSQVISAGLEATG